MLLAATPFRFRNHDAAEWWRLTGAALKPPVSHLRRPNLLKRKQAQTSLDSSQQKQAVA